MSVSASIPATVQIRRGHLLGLIGVAAALAACVTAVVPAVAFDSGTSGAVSKLDQRLGVERVPATFTLTRKQIEGLSTMAQQTAGHADPLLSMTPAQLAGVGLERGTAADRPELADLGGRPGVDEPRDSAVHRVSHEPHVEQLAAGGAGHP